MTTDQQERESRTIDAREVYGICFSQSGIVPLHLLSQKASISDILAEHKVEDLIQEVLHGSKDYVARAGEPVDIVEQAWDERLYVSNPGGSHRFAAIWRWHRENGIPLLMDCSVRTTRIAPETLKATETHRYWILSVERDFFEFLKVLSLAGDRSLFPEHARWDGDIALRPLSLWERDWRAPGFLDGGRSRFTYFIAYLRDHPLASVMDRWLEPSSALDLSNAVKLIAAGRYP